MSFFISLQLLSLLDLGSVMSLKTVSGLANDYHTFLGCEYISNSAVFFLFISLKNFLLKEKSSWYNYFENECHFLSLFIFASLKLDI